MKAEHVDFVFEYEVKPREFSSICLVAAYLRNKGYSVAFVNSWEGLYHKPKAYSANVAVISACYNNGTYDFFTGLIASYKKVVNMQWEQVLANGYYSQKRNDDSYVYKDVGRHTRHVCWGEKEKNWLHTRFGVDEDYLRVVGYLPLDFYREELRPLLIPREKLFRKYGLDPSKKTLLFVSSFSAIDLPATEDCGDEEMFSVSVKISHESQRILLSWFERFIQEHAETQIVYRYHPTEKNNPVIQKWVDSNKNIYAIAELPISHWIMACDKIYNWCSTSMVEMMCSGKDTYLCRPIAVPEPIDISYFQYARSLSSYEEFEQSAMERKMTSFPIESKQIMEWYDIQEEPTYQRIGDWLIQTYHDGGYTSRPSNNNVHLHTIKKRINGKIKRTAVYKEVSKFCIMHMGKSRLTRRLYEIQASTLAEDKHRHASQEENGYIQSKYQLNKATKKEIDETIEQYQHLIKMI